MLLQRTQTDLTCILGFPHSSVGKESARNAGDPGWIPGLGRSSGEENGNPLQLFLPGESHGQRGLGGYSSRGCKSRTRLSNKTTTTYTLTCSRKLFRQLLMQQQQQKCIALSQFSWKTHYFPNNLVIIYVNF